MKLSENQRSQNHHLKANALPRICFMSYYKLIQFSQPVVHEYAHKAHIESVDASFYQALNIAKERIKNNAVDVFVSAGSNASILKEHLQIPVISVEVSGYDILKALLEAKSIGRKVGIISYKNVLPSLNEFSELLNLELFEYTYTTSDDALLCIKDLKQNDIDVILGSSLIVDLATKLGMKTVLSYSLDSIRNAFDQALEVCRIKKLEENRFNQIHTILQTLPEAVVAVDTYDRITAINQKMLDILSPAKINLIGRTLAEIEPQLSLVPQLLNATNQLSNAIQLVNKNWISVSSAIMEDQTVIGATLTLYDANTILKADEKLRMFERSKLPQAKYTFDDIQTHNTYFATTISKAKRYAQTDLDILILGETGTGKELFAQAIHNASNRADQPFIAINCAAFPESLIESELFGHDEGAFTGAKKGGRNGFIEAAHKGTLFLDEIGDMPLQLQTRLLRVLQEREVTRLGSNVSVPVDIRVIAATHQNLTTLIDEHKFRADLYYRLNSLDLRLTPLRERPQDIINQLKNHFEQCSKQSEEIAITELIDQLIPYFIQYSWQGNFRELNMVLQRIKLLLSINPDINLDDIAQEIPDIFESKPHQNILAEQTKKVAIKEIHPIQEHISMSKKQHAHQAMQMVNGKATEAAKMLGVSRTTLWRWLNDDV